MESKSLLGKVKIRTKIIVPTILVLVLSNLVSVFTSAYRMDDLAKDNAKTALVQLTDSIFLNLRTAMNTGDSTIIADAEEKARKDIQGLEKFVVARSQNMIKMFSPQVQYTTDKKTLEVFASKKPQIIEEYKNGEHLIRSLKPMLATDECIYCHVNQQKGDVIGVMDLTFNLEASDKIINSTVYNLVIQALVVLTLITIFMTVLIRRATKPIDVFQRGLEAFFKYINKEEKDVGYIDGYSHDEIGELVNSVNKNIDSTVAGVRKDEKVIEEAKEVCKKASIGIYDVKITAEAHSPELNELKELVNNLIDAMGYNIGRVSKVLTSYDENNYVDRVSSSGKTTGSMKAVFDKVDSLGNSLSQNAKTNLQTGMQLDDDASILEEVVTKIEKYLERQTNELESSVEQLSNITEAIRQTTRDAVKMADYAKHVTNSVEAGQELANKTSTEMDEIAEQVTAINDAINIIDEIAFQTNILSLNAAVEAATAGEAGKGFAVVAGEVRNLANRSAEAAKEIKGLVESATAKAADGKEISDQMISGYNKLNESITSTIELIENVTTASKEQQSGIEQINTNVSNVKGHTIKSKKMAHDAKDIAVATNQLATELVRDAQEKKFS